MKSIRRLSIAILIQSFLSAAFAKGDSTNDNEIIQEIREIYSEAIRIEADSMTTKIELMQLSDGKFAAPWVKFNAESSYVSFAAVYMIDNRVSSARISILPPSGDWAMFNSYYFRVDGTLAFVYSELRTFFGEVRVERRLYYDSSGSEIRELKSMFDLFSGDKVDRDYMGRAPEIYMSVGQLVKAFGRENIYGTEGNDPKSSGKSDKTD